MEKTPNPPPPQLASRPPPRVISNGGPLPTPPARRAHHPRERPARSFSSSSRRQLARSFARSGWLAAAGCGGAGLWGGEGEREEKQLSFSRRTAHNPRARRPLCAPGLVGYVGDAPWAHLDSCPAHPASSGTELGVLGEPPPPGMLEDFL